MVHINDIIAKYTPQTTYHINRPKPRQQSRKRVEQSRRSQVPKQQSRHLHRQHRKQTQGQRTLNKGADTMARPTLNLVKGLSLIHI